MEQYKRKKRGGRLINSFKHIYQRMPINEKNIDYLKKKTIYGGELTAMFRGSYNEYDSNR